MPIPIPALARLFPLAFLALTGASAQPIPPRSLELAGTFNLSTAWVYGDSPSTILSLSPAVHFYPVPTAFVGPILQYGRLWGDEYSSHSLGVGAEAGVLTAKEAAPYQFYAGGGASFQSRTSDFEVSGSGDYSDRDSDWLLELFVGIKARLGGNFLLNLQPTWTYMATGRDLHVIGIRAGFSGLLGD